MDQDWGRLMSFGLVGGRLLDGAHVAAKTPSFTSSFLPEESPDALVIRTNTEMVPQQRDARPGGPAAGLFGALEPPHKLAELSQAALAKKYPPGKVTIWFDLGNVVVDLSSPSGLSQMMPNAFNYILTLKSKGYQVGVMTNYGQKFFPVPLEEQQRNLQTTITRT
ncbi:MAG: hypothetical protein R3C68_10825 [Myxococcota bacterium]